MYYEEKNNTEDWKFKQVGGSHYMYMKLYSIPAVGG